MARFSAHPPSQRVHSANNCLKRDCKHEVLHSNRKPIQKLSAKREGAFYHEHSSCPHSATGTDNDTGVKAQSQAAAVFCTTAPISCLTQSTNPPFMPTEPSSFLSVHSQPIPSTSTHPHFPGSFSVTSPAHASFVTTSTIPASTTEIQSAFASFSTHPHLPGSFSATNSSAPADTDIPDVEMSYDASGQGFFKGVFDRLRFAFVGRVPPPSFTSRTTTPAAKARITKATAPVRSSSTGPTQEQIERLKRHRAMLKERREARFAAAHPGIPRPRARPPSLQEVFGPLVAARAAARERSKNRAPHRMLPLPEPMKPHTDPFTPWTDDELARLEKDLNVQLDFQRRLLLCKAELERVQEDAENIWKKEREHSARVRAYRAWAEETGEYYAEEAAREEAFDNHWIAVHTRRIMMEEERQRQIAVAKEAQLRELQRQADLREARVQAEREEREKRRKWEEEVKHREEEGRMRIAEMMERRRRMTEEALRAAEDLRMRGQADEAVAHATRMNNFQHALRKCADHDQRANAMAATAFAAE